MIQGLAIHPYNHAKVILNFLWSCIKWRLFIDLLQEFSFFFSLMYFTLVGNDPIEEDIDIVGNEAPVSSYPPVEIEKDTEHRSSKCILSGSFSGNSLCSHCGFYILVFYILHVFLFPYQFLYNFFFFWMNS